MAWVTEVLLGSITSGVNQPTYVTLNVVLALAFCSLILLLVTSIAYSPALVPHVIVLLVLAAGLWASINWLIQNVGLVDAKQQQEELFGKEGEAKDQQDKAAQSGDSSKAAGEQGKEAKKQQ